MIDPTKEAVDFFFTHRCRSEHDTGRHFIGGVPTGAKEESIFPVIVQCRLTAGHRGPHLPPISDVYNFDDEKDAWL